MSYAPPAKSINVRVVNKLVEDGRLSKAIKKLIADRLAPISIDTLRILEEKHPSGICPTPPTVTHDPFQATPELVLSCLCKFKHTSVGGLSDLKPSHLLDMIKANVHVNVLECLTTIINLFLAGSVPPIARSYLLGARLTAIFKKDGGIRPIACGDLYR